jgi:hypothetical protein
MACELSVTPTPTSAPTPEVTPTPAAATPTATPEPTSATGGTDQSKANIESLIQDLNSEDPEVVLWAEAELVEIGQPALEQLEAAVEDQSLTVAQRSKLEEIIAAIELRSTPGFPDPGYS